MHSLSYKLCYKVIHRLSHFSLCAFQLLSIYHLFYVKLRKLWAVVRWISRRMAMAGEIFRRSFPETIDQVCDDSSSSSELHVLAVDDSLVDRKVIERLLKISSCKGIYMGCGWFCRCCFWFEKMEKGFGFWLVFWSLVFDDPVNVYICSHCCREWNKGFAVSGFGWRESLGWFQCKK